MRIAWYEEGSSKQKSTYDSPSTESTEWATIEFTIQVPENISTAKLRLLATSTSETEPVSILYDELTLVETSPTPTIVPTETPTPTPIPSNTPTPTLIPSEPPDTDTEPESTILGTETEPDGELSLASNETSSIQSNYVSSHNNQPNQDIASSESQSTTNVTASKTIPFILIIGGAILFAISSYIYICNSGILSSFNPNNFE